MEVDRGRGYVSPLFKKGPFYGSVSTLLSLFVDVEKIDNMYMYIIVFEAFFS